MLLFLHHLPSIAAVSHRVCNGPRHLEQNLHLIITPPCLRLDRAPLCRALPCPARTIASNIQRVPQDGLQNEAPAVLSHLLLARTEVAQAEAPPAVIRL